MMRSGQSTVPSGTHRPVSAEAAGGVTLPDKIDRHDVFFLDLRQKTWQRHS
jgi:hypothetical protein